MTADIAAILAIDGIATGAVYALVAIGTVLIFLKLGEQATYWERAIQGAFILLAVLADHLIVSKKKGHA